MAIAGLPNLRILALDFVDSELLLDNQDLVKSETLFTSLQELHLSDTPRPHVLRGVLSESTPTPCRFVCELLCLIPDLNSFAWRTRATISPATILNVLSTLRKPHALHRLSFEQMPRFLEVADTHQFAVALANCVPMLESLAVPTSLFNTLFFVDVVAERFTHLKVFGHSEAKIFDGWLSLRGRQFRFYDVYDPLSLLSSLFSLLSS